MTATSVERLFSEHALALAPRALVAGRSPGASEPVAALFVRHLSPAARRAVADAGGRLRPVPGGLRLELVPARLDELAGDEPDLALCAQAWRAACRPPRRPRLMGVVNVTDDSFSDGGRFRSVDAAVEQGLKLLTEGADILDVGGESTRPGSRAVSVDEELDRVVPVLERLVDEASPVLSIDTQKSQVAEAALAAGATIVNDVSAGLADPELLGVAARHGAELVLMHMRGTPATMQRDPRYDDVVGEVVEHLRTRVAAGLKAGVPVPRITVDPGIGFGKRIEDNLMLLRATSELRSLGLSVLIGVSRKSFLGTLGGVEEPAQRDAETDAAVALSTFLGADVQRVHDVDAARRVVTVASALAAGAPV